MVPPHRTVVLEIVSVALKVIDRPSADCHERLLWIKLPSLQRVRSSYGSGRNSAANAKVELGKLPRSSNATFPHHPWTRSCRCGLRGFYTCPTFGGWPFQRGCCRTLCDRSYGRRARIHP